MLHFVRDELRFLFFRLSFLVSLSINDECQARKKMSQEQNIKTEMNGNDVRCERMSNVDAFNENYNLKCI